MQAHISIYPSSAGVVTSQSIGHPTPCSIGCWSSLAQWSHCLGPNCTGATCWAISPRLADPIYAEYPVRLPVRASNLDMGVSFLVEYTVVIYF